MKSPVLIILMVWESKTKLNEWTWNQDKPEANSCNHIIVPVWAETEPLSGWWILKVGGDWST